MFFRSCAVRSTLSSSQGVVSPPLLDSAPSHSQASAQRSALSGHFPSAAFFLLFGAVLQQTPTLRFVAQADCTSAPRSGSSSTPASASSTARSFKRGDTTPRRAARSHRFIFSQQMAQRLNRRPSRPQVVFADIRKQALQARPTAGHVALGRLAQLRSAHTSTALAEVTPPSAFPPPHHSHEVFFRPPPPQPPPAPRHHER